MKWHVLRPLWLAVGLLAVILVAREFLVPDDFGVHGPSFTYNFYRLSNVDEWKNFPVKYQGRESCVECHEENVTALNASPHAPIECENCHGPAIGHPDDIEYLPIERAREHCLRCHGSLDYPHSARADLPNVSGAKHKRRRECVKCHYPHDPREDA
jgi:DnaJ-class molecular chaperone